jgi:hypothetical protein
MVYLPNTRVRRWLVVVFAVVVLLLTIQFHVSRVPLCAMVHRANPVQAIQPRRIIRNLAVARLDLVASRPCHFPSASGS